MSLVEIVPVAIKKQMREIAEIIEGEMKAEASNHRPSYRTPTGAAAAAIHIEERGEYKMRIGATAYFSGGDGDGGTHLYYMTQGNSGNGSDGRIHPTRHKALHLKDGSVRKSVGTYKGRNFIKTIADRHR